VEIGFKGTQANLRLESDESSRPIIYTAKRWMLASREHNKFAIRSRRLHSLLSG
jgi:hypothetical protein